MTFVPIICHNWVARYFNEFHFDILELGYNCYGSSVLCRNGIYDGIVPAANLSNFPLFSGNVTSPKPNINQCWTKVSGFQSMFKLIYGLFSLQATLALKLDQSQGGLIFKSKTFAVWQKNWCVTQWPLRCCWWLAEKSLYFWSRQWHEQNNMQYDYMKIEGLNTKIIWRMKLEIQTKTPK